MKYCVRQGSTVGPLLFLLYVNDLQFASDLLDPIMFTDNTNLFYSNRDINTVFLKVNDQLQKIKKLFSKILNVYKLNIFNIAVFMYKIQGKSTPSIFLSKFRKTRFSYLNYIKPIPTLNKCKYGISYRGPFIWNKLVSTTDKQITDVAKFKAVTKSKLLSLDN